MRFTAQPPAIVAHRGASAYAPENTPAAFALALLQGADAIELDVRATRDGDLVLLHDETLLRTTGDPRAVAETTRTELDALDGAVRPPSLAHVLDCFGDETSYLIEVKRIPGPCEPALVQAIASRGLRERVVVQSFDHLLLRRLSLRDPRLAVAALLPAHADAHRSLEVVAPFVSGIGPCWSSVDAGLVDAAHERGLDVRAWTVNSPEEMARMTDLGVDALITDAPDTARALVGAPDTLQSAPFTARTG
jgi:glycerophosphoryl diester phosphodiesterase